MKPLAAALLISLVAASQASALSVNMSLPDLTFPPSTTSISTQNAAQPGK